MNENDNSAKDWLSNADMLTEALPYMQKYAGLNHSNKIWRSCYEGYKINKIFLRGYCSP